MADFYHLLEEVCTENCLERIGPWLAMSGNPEVVESEDVKFNVRILLLIVNLATP